MVTPRYVAVVLQMKKLIVVAVRKFADIFMIQHQVVVMAQWHTFPKLLQAVFMHYLKLENALLVYTMHYLKPENTLLVNTIWDLSNLGNLSRYTIIL